MTSLSLPGLGESDEGNSRQLGWQPLQQPDPMTEHSSHSLPEEDLLDLYEQMIGGPDLKRNLQQVTRAIQQATLAEGATTYLVQDDTRELISTAIVGNVVKDIRIPISPRSLAGYSAHSGEAFLIHDAYQDLSYVHEELQFDRTWDEINQFRTRDVMCAPVQFKGELLGVIQVINSTGPAFDDDAMARFRVISRIVSYALFHARQYDELASMKELKKQRARFMRVMMHELKAPVSSARTLLSGMMFAFKEDGRIQSALCRVSAQMDRLISLVEDLLHFSRIQEGSPLGSIEEIHLQRDIQLVAVPYQDQARGKQLQFSIEFPDEPVWVRFDRKGLHLVVSNLLSNAIKYTPSGRVTLRLSSDGDRCVLSVSDTGIGIPKQDLPRMFGEFFRASNARSSEVKGTGVGLAGTKEIVNRFGGHIELGSELGKGTTFKVSLRTCPRPD